MKLLYLLSLILTCHIVNAQSYGEMLNKLRNAISVTIIDKDTVEFKKYFTDEQAFQQASNFLFSIKEKNRKLEMTAEQIGVYKKSMNGIDSLTIVYMGGDDERNPPAMLGQMILTAKTDTKDWLFTSTKSIIPAKKVKDPLRYLQVYINMHGMPPPEIEELK